MIIINHLIASGNIGPLHMQILPLKEFEQLVLLFGNMCYILDDRLA